MLTELGRRLANVRKQLGWSQEALAERAGVGVATLRRIEDGRDGKLGSWLRILVALERVEAVEQMLPEEFRSPMAEVKAARRRRRKKKSKNTDTPNDDGTGPGFVWGDERR
jgi:transcriptional regulator with XRE-family HTH domain